MKRNMGTGNSKKRKLQEICGPDVLFSPLCFSAGYDKKAGDPDFEKWLKEAAGVS
jgi:hypothetical protein